MDGYKAQASRTGAGRHLLLYDGVCPLCNRLVRAILTRDRLGVFHFASLQSPVAAEQLARSGGQPGDLSSSVVIAEYRGGAPVRLAKARAALFVLLALGWPCRAATLLRLLPAVLLDRMYDLIARNRYGMLGRRDRCMAPTPEYRRRFIDSIDEVVSKAEVGR